MDQFLASAEEILGDIGSFVWGPFLLIPLLLFTGLYRLRLVTHLDVSADDVRRVVASVARHLA